MKIFNLLLSLVAACVAFNATAGEQDIRRGMKMLFPDIEITRVNKTIVNDIYEVLIGTDVIYVTGDARFIFKGDLIDVQGRRNISKDVREETRADFLKKIPVNEYIEFPSANNKHTVYVFTDVDCGYCRQLHMDVPVLNEHLITVRYLAYPRGGTESYTYEKMVDIWCAEDRLQAMTDAKSGVPVKAADCKNPVANQYELGQKMGVRGTPAIFLEDGRDMPGYLPPGKLLEALSASR